MRNAVANLDDDLAFDEPARKQKARGKPRVSARKKTPAKGKRPRARYIHYVAVGLSASLAMGIVVNALMLQRGHHPAPLFGKAVSRADSQPSSAVPVPPPAPRVQAEPAANAPGGDAPTQATPAPDAAPKPSARARHAGAEQASPLPHARNDDAIARLLQKASPAAPAEKPTGARARDADRAKASERAKVAERGKEAEHGKEADHAKEADRAKEPERAKELERAKSAERGKEGERAADKEHAKEIAKENPKTVMAAQHALMKLGFVVKPNGSFGPQTRAAIEAFERDQHLPVKAELSRKILKQLAAESGVAID